MTEDIEVKLFKGNKFVENKKFTSYNKAFDFVQKYVTFMGYSAILLRLVNGKEWVKLTFYPPETV